jgi:hypothetical protein
MNYKIILVKIDHRSHEAEQVQKVFTEYGCIIKVRLGLHENSNDLCAQDGLVILHVEGKESDIKAMLEKLNLIDFVHAKIMEM